MPKDEFMQRMYRMRRGDRLIYFIGDLMYACDITSNSAVRELSNAAWEAYKQGLITMVQKKLGENDYQYIAVRL